MPTPARRPAFTLIELPAMRNLRPCSGRAGFTLIELLVVVTIIVVLLALLVPAMDKAIYQAEMVICMTNLKAVATGALTYAADNKRRYLYRDGIANDGEMPIYAWRPNTISDSIASDDRKGLATFLSLNKALNCPFNEDVDFEGSDSDTVVESDYNLWFGFKYPDHSGMNKIGDKVSWDGQRFSILADDYTMIHIGLADNHGTHNDRDGAMKPVKAQDEGAIKFTLSRWTTDRTTYIPGPVDRNFAYDDGSVTRMDNFLFQPTSAENPNGLDERLAALPPYAESKATTGDYMNTLPKRPH